MHPAEKIAQAFVTTVTGLTTTGSRVYRGRIVPTEKGEQNCILVNIGAEKMIAELSQDVIDARLRIETVVRVKTSTQQIDTELMSIRQELEIAVHANHTLALPFVHEVEQGDVSEPDLHGDGDKRVADLTLEWFVRYRRSRTNPNVA